MSEEKKGMSDWLIFFCVAVIVPCITVIICVLIPFAFVIGLILILKRKSKVKKSPFQGMEKAFDKK